MQTTLSTGDQRRGSFLCVWITNGGLLGWGTGLVVLLVWELKLNGSLRWKVRIMEEKRERHGAKEAQEPSRSWAWGQDQANSAWGLLVGTVDNACLPSIILHTYPGHRWQPLCLSISHLIFSKQHQKDIMGKSGTESDFLTLVLWFLVMLYIHLFGRVGVDTTSGEALQRSNISSLSGEN